MSRLVATIDLASAVVGSHGDFETQTPNACSALCMRNESSAFLQLDLGVNGQPIVQPWYNRTLELNQAIQNASWTVLATLQSGGAPSSAVYVEAIAPNEPRPADGPVFRQSNIGNSVPVGTSSTSITNDGNAAGTVVVEATPSGAASSEAKLTNDGAFLCGGGLFSISNAGVVTAIPAGAIPATGVATGYPAADLGAGTLPSGVAVPVANVATGYPAADVGAGALPSGVTLDAAQVSGGALTVASANVTGGVSAGSLTLPGASAGQEVGSTSTANTPHIDFHSAGGNLDYDSRIIASGGSTTVVGQGGIDVYGAAGVTVHAPLKTTGDAFWQTAAGDASGPRASYDATNHLDQYWTPQSGTAAQGHEFVTWNGSAQKIPFGVGGAASALALCYVDDSGDLATKRVTPLYGGSLAGISHLSGSGSATVNHGLSTIPDAAVVNTNNGSNSTTYGSGSYTATTVYIYQFNAQAWTGLAYVH